MRTGEPGDTIKYHNLTRPAVFLGFRDFSGNVKISLRIAKQAVFLSFYMLSWIVLLCKGADQQWSANMNKEV